jgi:hypothetical protein
LKDAYYFPHFSNARHDRKLQRIRKELGIEGYGIYFMLLEVLREMSDFSYPMSDIDLLADEFGTSEQKVRTVVTNYGLFEVDELEQFFSPKLLIYLEPYFKMKEQRRLAGVASGKVRHNKQISRGTTVERPLNGCGTTVERTLNENEQSKVKESKVKESKVKESKEEELNADYVAIVSLLMSKIEENDPKHFQSKNRKVVLRQWYDPIRLLIERDGREPDLVRSVITWSQRDSFWKSNILSTKKLREKFPQLLLQMNNGKNKSLYEEELIETYPSIDVGDLPSRRPTN